MSRDSKFPSKKMIAFILIILSVVIGSFALASPQAERIDPQEGYNETSSIRSLEKETISDIASVERLQNSFNIVVNQILPSVVEIDVTEKLIRQVPSFNGFPWFFDSQPDSEEYEANSLGSGVIFRKIDNTYYVLTNDHVAGKADEIEVVLNDTTRYDAVLVGTDSRRDLAVVSFISDDDTIPVAVLGDSDALRVGDWVLAMGSPYGFYSSVTAGIVSALGRSGREVNNLNDFIQTDAAINQGNSGGPLVNIYGEVVGINTWIAAPSGGSIGLGFAIPINNAKQIIDEFFEFGKVRDGWLGVSMIDTTQYKDFFKDLGLQNFPGVFIANVYGDSPADRAGLRPGDLITVFNGTPLSNTESLSRLISNSLIGEALPVTVVRKGQEISLTVTLEERQSEEEISSTLNKLWPGLLVQPLTDKIRDSLSITRTTDGLLVIFMGGDNETNAFGAAGIQNYDIITAINGVKMSNVYDFYEVISDPKISTFSVEIQRGELKGTFTIQRGT